MPKFASDVKFLSVYFESSSYPLLYYRSVDMREMLVMPGIHSVTVSVVEDAH